MKNITRTMLCIALFTLVLSSCTKEKLVGEGNIVTETRSLNSFNKLGISGNRAVEIIKSTESKVEITGYSNLVRAFKDEISNGRLVFNYPNFLTVRNDNIKLKVYTPEIEAVQMSGKCDVLVGEGFTGQSFNADISGSADLNMLASSYNNVDLKISGSAQVHAKPVIVKTAVVHISGSAEVKLSVADNLKVRISGSGKVMYWGNPATDVKVSGSGQAVQQ